MSTVAVLKKQKDALERKNAELQKELDAARAKVADISTHQPSRRSKRIAKKVNSVTYQAPATDAQGRPIARQTLDQARAKHTQWNEQTAFNQPLVATRYKTIDPDLDIANKLPGDGALSIEECSIRYSDKIAKALVAQALENDMNIKFRLRIRCLMSRGHDEEKSAAHFEFDSSTVTIRPGDSGIRAKVKNAFSQCHVALDAREHEGSGWALEEVESVWINSNLFVPIRMGRYITTPEWLAAK